MQVFCGSSDPHVPTIVYGPWVVQDGWTESIAWCPYNLLAVRVEAQVR